MANHTRGPRGRSRKPRPAVGTAERPAERVRSRRTDPPSGSKGRVPSHRAFDERPPAPWHPLPLSELLILVGAVAFAVALSRLGHHGLASGGPLLLVGVLAVAFGTGEVTWREHRSGFRSHTLLLAFMPVLALHTAVVIGYASLAKPSRALNIGMSFIDLAVFVLLFRLLRRRFLDARARR